MPFNTFKEEIKMRISVPKTEYRGTVKAPPSKSMAHRALICAGLCEGESVIRGISHSEDMKATIDCLRALGAKIDIVGDTATVFGTDPTKRDKSVILPCRESGSTLRFFIPICLLSGCEATLTGSERLLERPLSVYEELCREQGIIFERRKNGIYLRGELKKSSFTVSGDISSQFITGLMLALPFMSGGQIEIIPPIASLSYIKMTAAAMRHFGAEVELAADNKVKISGKLSPHSAEIEGDWSNAAFFLALDALGFEVYPEGLDTDSLQGDKIIRRYLAKLCRGNPTLDVTDCPDLAPVLMAVAAAKNGARLLGTSRLKLKESDRGQAMAQELAKFGVEVLLGEDDIIVFPCENLASPKIPINSHNDHRIAMACAVLMTLTGGEIDGAEAVSKSYPDFFERLFELRA